MTILNNAVTSLGRRSRATRTFLYALLTTALIVPLLQIWYPYMYGESDQTILLVPGIRLADPTAYINDWAFASAPQPHWFFALFTAAFEKLGVLPLAVLGWWIATAFVVSLSNIILARAWFPSRRPIAGVVATVFTLLWPIYAFGSAGPFLPSALPAALGAALVCLSTALLFARRFTTAMIITLAACLIHVQLGLIAALALGVVATLSPRLPTRTRMALGATFVAGLAIAVAVTTLQHTVSRSGDAKFMCEHWIPVHCSADTWSRATIAISFGFIVAAVLIGGIVWRTRGHKAVVVGTLFIPVAALLVVFASDYFNIQPGSATIQSLFINRFATPFIPMLPWLAFLAGRLRMRRQWAFLCAVGLIVGYTAMTGFDDHPWLRGLLGGHVALALLFATAFVTYAFLDHAPTTSRLRTLLLIFLMGVVAVAARPTWSNLTSWAVSGNQVHADVGEEVRAHTPPGAIIVTDPLEYWVRLWTRRAVVVDCKYAPYSGPAIDEFFRRLGDFGGCNFVLSAALIDGISRRYLAPYILLPPGASSTGLLELGYRTVLGPDIAKMHGYSLLKRDS